MFTTFELHVVDEIEKPEIYYRNAIWKFKFHFSFWLSLKNESNKWKSSQHIRYMFLIDIWIPSKSIFGYNFEQIIKLLTVGCSDIETVLEITTTTTKISNTSFPHLNNAYSELIYITAYKRDSLCKCLTIFQTNATFHNFIFELMIKKYQRKPTVFVYIKYWFGDIFLNSFVPLKIVWNTFWQAFRRFLVWFDF